MSREPASIELSAHEQQVLRSAAQSDACAPRERLRAQIVLLAAERATNTQIAAQTGVSIPTVALWRKRFLDHRLDGLAGGHLEARIGLVGRETRRTQFRGWMEQTKQMRSPPSPSAMFAETGPGKSSVVPLSRPQPDIQHSRCHLAQRPCQADRARNRRPWYAGRRGRDWGRDATGDVLDGNFGCSNRR